MNHKIVKSTLLVNLFLFCAGSIFAQSKSEELLNKVSEELSSYQTMSLAFDYSLENPAEGVSQETNGTAYLKGDKYHIDFLGSIFLFDGSRTIVIIPDDEEINISEGAMDDEGMMTPTKLLSFYKEGYTYQWDLKIQENGKNIQFIRLIPIDSNSEVGSMLLGIDVDKNQIYKLIETGKDGVVTTFKITSFKHNEELDSGLFEFDQAKYEALDYIINDTE